MGRCGLEPRVEGYSCATHRQALLPRISRPRATPRALLVFAFQRSSAITVAASGWGLVAMAWTCSLLEEDFFTITAIQRIRPASRTTTSGALQKTATVTCGSLRMEAA